MSPFPRIELTQDDLDRIGRSVRLAFRGFQEGLNPAARRRRIAAEWAVRVKPAQRVDRRRESADQEDR